MFSPADHQFMTQALLLAKEGLYSASPNPRVGCVIVKDGQVIGRGAHLKTGEPHAEVHALRDAQVAHAEATIGATAYVTLEPCSHHGRTPPCANALINAGIKRVVVAMQDPNELVAGQGIACLNAAGIKVEVGLLEVAAQALNVGFIKRMTQKLPYVRAKIAASLDGKTALNNGISQWITGEAARIDVQHWRAQSCAVVTGIGTVLADNPNMNVRLDKALRQPLRVIVDSQLATPLSANILVDITEQNPVLIAYAHDANHQHENVVRTGATLLPCANASQQVDLSALLTALAARGINEVLLEAGQTLSGAFLQAQLIDELIVYYAPKLMGQDAQGMFKIPEIVTMQAVPTFTLIDVAQFDQDIRLRLTLNP